MTLNPNIWVLTEHNIEDILKKRPDLSREELTQLLTKQEQGEFKYVEIDVSLTQAQVAAQREALETAPKILYTDSNTTVVHDPVNHPNHYTSYKGIEVIQLTEQMNFNRGNAVKYIARAGLKSPDSEVEDLKKAVWYIQREIERIQNG